MIAQPVSTLAATVSPKTRCAANPRMWVLSGYSRLGGGEPERGRHQFVRDDAHGGTGHEPGGGGRQAGGAPQDGIILLNVAGLA
jgi:hypothetical protein